MSDTQTWRDIYTQDDFYSIADVLTYVSIALQTQYNTSVRLMGLGEIFQDEIDASPELKQLLDDVFNLDNAEGVFLDWWGKRIGVERTIEINNSTVTLDDITYRTILKWRAATNVSRSDVKTLNDLFTRLLGLSTSVTDKGAMTIQLNINDAVDSSSLVVLRYFSNILKPAGVGINLTIDYSSMFGFNGQQLSLFNYGIFNTSPIS